MNKIILTISMFAITLLVIAQPTSFKYQTVVRDGNGETVTSQAVSFQLAILQGNASGTNVYTETHATNTNQFGLANLEIGSGSVVFGDFATIDWGADDYFLEISFDINGGNNYLLAGTSQLMAVPYALYAKNSGGSSEWQVNGDDIYHLDGRVGIGTNNPQRKLHIWGGDAQIEAPEWCDLTIRTTNPGTDAALALRTVTDGVWDNDNYWNLHNKPEHDNDLHFSFNTTPMMTLNKDGNLGIGNINPGSKLDIQGGTRFTVRLDSDGRSKVGNLYSSDDTLALVSFGSAEINIDGNNNMNDKVFRVVHNEGEELLRVQEDGRVGIGTSTPAGGRRLHLSGGDLLVETPQWADVTVRTTDPGTDAAVTLRTVTDGVWANDNTWSMYTDASEDNKLRFSNSISRMAITSDGIVGIGTSYPESSARLEVKSTDKGFLPPRMTESQRTSIASPATGLLVYQTTAPAGFYYYSGSSWLGLTSTGTGAISTSACIDYDGNAYPTFTIGNQVWMSENLRVTHYRNGDAIPNVTDNGAWSALSSGAYCVTGNGPQSSMQKWGALYNWYALNDSRGLCPEGWHVPTHEEWITFTTYLGGASIAGMKMKIYEYNLWGEVPEYSTNISNFSGRPNSYRQDDGSFTGGYDKGFWWSSTEYTSSSAYYRQLKSDTDLLHEGDYNKKGGYSVRCLRD